MRYGVVVKKRKDHYGAYVRGAPFDCYCEGKTEEEVLAKIKAAIPECVAAKEEEKRNTFIREVEIN